MPRRPSKSGTPLTAKQEELARREQKLRDEMQQLEREIAEAPKRAAEKSRRQREQIHERASAGGSRLDVSIALNDKRFLDGGRYSGKRGALRKERREGRFVFLVLVIALVVAVLWLMSNLRF